MESKRERYLARSNRKKMPRVTGRRKKGELSEAFVISDTESEGYSHERSVEQETGQSSLEDGDSWVDHADRAEETGWGDQADQVD
jgi:hypothetical protein